MNSLKTQTRPLEEAAFATQRKDQRMSNVPPNPEPVKSPVTTDGPWTRLAAESRWRALTHLRNERREGLRQILIAHAEKMGRVIADRRGRRS